MQPLPDDPDTLISRRTLAEILPVSFPTLERWAHEETGPPYIRLGRRVAYRAGDVRRWLRSRPRGGSDLEALETEESRDRVPA